jgi:hypothetical protein
MTIFSVFNFSFLFGYLLMWKLHEFGATDLEFKKIRTPLRRAFKGFETFRKGCLLNCVFPNVFMFCCQ